jgi:ParB family transcriptional regulator, chromosome partitioning protein
MRDKSRAMGRGLSAILNAEAKASIHSANDAGAQNLVGNIVDIPLADISPNKNQPRSFFDEKALAELAESISHLGIIQPITLRKEGDQFLIISGERRFRASKMLGLKTIPAYIRLIDDQVLLEMALVENIQREDLDAIEVAITYQRLMDEVGLTQDNLSKRIGKERSTITNAIRLLKLSPEIQLAIRNGSISAGHGRSILSLETEELQKHLFDKIVSQGLNVRQAEAEAKSLKLPVEKEKKEIEIPNHIRKFEKDMSDLLAINVQVKASAKGDKGKVILEFNSEEELNRILDIMN